MIDRTTTVAELVLDRPGRARVFEGLGLDYCCGGNRTLAEACAERGLDVDTVLAFLRAEGAEAPEEPDWRGVPLPDLCAHIVDVHHARLRVELPRLSVLLEKVVRAHGRERPELAELRTTFESLRAELEDHMADEERRLFPACRDGEALDPALLAELEAEHAHAGAELERLRALTGDYDADAALCNTHRATVDALRELEADLHVHIHEENNVLFPRALAA